MLIGYLFVLYKCIVSELTQFSVYYDIVLISVTVEVISVFINDNWQEKQAKIFPVESSGLKRFFKKHD